MEYWSVGFLRPITPALQIWILMAAQTLHLDLRGRKPDQQVDCLKEQYVALRGTGSVVRAQVEERPVRQYISMLERGYRVTLEREGEATWLVSSPT